MGYSNDIEVSGILVSCCILCGFGCYGGLPKMAWYYWVHSGIVTGGRYGSKSGCQPYMIPPTGLCYGKSAYLDYNQ